MTVATFLVDLFIKFLSTLSLFAIVMEQKGLKLIL